MGIEEEEFKLLLADKKHKETIGILNKLLKEVTNIDLNAEIKVDTSKIESIIEAIGTVQNTETIPKAITAIGDAILMKLDSLKKDPTPTAWQFTVKRDSKGLIDIVNAKAK